MGPGGDGDGVGGFCGGMVKVVCREVGDGVLLAGWDVAGAVAIGEGGEKVSVGCKTEEGCGASVEPGPPNGEGVVVGMWGEDVGVFGGELGEVGEDFGDEGEGGVEVDGVVL